MLVLGLKGSPRKKGNTDYMLRLFLREAENRGWETSVVDAVKERYEPCMGCGSCEKKGVCILEDTMAENLFPLMRRADVIVVSVPVYFYAVPARIKALMDRVQTLWSRKYIYKIKDPGHDFRKGVLLGAGATQGRDLFDGIYLNVKYFLDATGTKLEESLCYRGIDARGEMEKHPTIQADITALAQKVLSPFEKRKTWLFACRENAGRSQMAAAFARSLAGDRIEVVSAGSQPTDKINPLAVEAMAEKGVDMAFLKPHSLEGVLKKIKPDLFVTMGCGEACPLIPDCRMVEWELPDPAGRSLAGVQDIRDEIENRVRYILDS